METGRQQGPRRRAGVAAARGGRGEVREAVCGRDGQVLAWAEAGSRVTRRGTRAADDEELLEAIPEDEKQRDPKRHARVCRNIDGEMFYGEVADIQRGMATKERLYKIKYDDGDEEHYTYAEVVVREVAGRGGRAQAADRGG